MLAARSTSPPCTPPASPCTPRSPLGRHPGLRLRLPHGQGPGVQIQRPARPPGRRGRALRDRPQKPGDLRPSASGPWSTRRAFLGLAVSAGLYVRGRGRLRRGLVDKGMSCLVAGRGAKRDCGGDRRVRREVLQRALLLGIEWNRRFSAWTSRCSTIWSAPWPWLATCWAPWRRTSWSREGLQQRHAGLRFLNGVVRVRVHVPLNTLTCTRATFSRRVVSKMCWGCWCFYPFFYCVGVWPLVSSENYANGVHFLGHGLAGVSPSSSRAGS